MFFKPLKFDYFKEFGIKWFAFPVISGSKLVVANMMVIGGLYGQ